jgi:ankyrin repeat protein
VKEFILQRATLNDRLPQAIGSITQEDCTLAIATACINMLALDDFGEDLFARVAGSSARPSFDSSIRYQGSSGTCSVRPSIDTPSPALDDGSFNLTNLFKDSTARDQDTSQDLAAQYPFYRYAALHWAEHFAHCEAVSPRALRNAVQILLDTANTKCNNWLRFYAAETNQTFLTDLNSLPLAAFFNHGNAVKSCLDNNERITQNDLDNALFWAAYEGHHQIVGELLAAGAEPNIQEPSTGQTPLVAASKNGHLSCAQMLLRDGRTDINTEARHGRTALSHACGAGYSEIAEALLSRQDCDVNAADWNSRTALMWAVEGVDISSVELLIQHIHRLDINHRDKTGRTAVSLAAGDASSSKSVMILEKLIALKRQGIDLNLKDNQGRSPLSWAAGNGCTGALKRLLHSNRVDRATVDNTGRNAISWACGAGHVQTLDYLLRKKCPGINDRDESGWSPLAWAIQQPSPATTAVLLEHGADVDGRDHGGRTALSWAAGYGHILVVRELLMRGADPNNVNERGETPVAFAERYASEDVMRELRWYMGQA